MLEGLFDGSNPYFAAGAGMIGLTAVSGICLKGAGQLAFIAKRRLLVSLEIPIKDQSYPWFLEWMSKQNKNNEKRSFLGKLINKQLHQLSVETNFTRLSNGSISTNFSLVPGQGKHFFQWKGAFFQVERNRSSTTAGVTTGSSPWETVIITTLSRDRNLFMDMLQEAKQDALSKEEGKTIVFTSYGPDWRPFGSPRRRRSLDTVVLNGSIASDIVKDVKQFLESSAWYYDRGIPYRRGYLLYGPPGSGKSSFIQALAGQLEYNICILSLSEMGMTDDRFAHLLTNIPPRSVILLEDIDAAFPDRSMQLESVQKGYQSSLTLSGLLNGLDGVVASEERIIFMTTNHLEKLDSALVRPGRVDYKVFLGNVTEAQAESMFLRFYADESDSCRNFVERLKGLGLIGKVSPAFLQGHFVIHRDSARNCIDSLVSISD